MGQVTLRIINPNPIQEKSIVELVDLILYHTQSIDYHENLQKQKKVKMLEGEIDQFVYKFYDLTPEEIKIVEGKDDSINARSRVASALLRWAQDQGTMMRDTVEISTIPKQQEMANYVGLTRETLNRTLGELEQEGFIQKPDIRTIVVTNFSYFKKIFGPFY